MNSAKQSWISSRSFHEKSIRSPHLTFFFIGGLHGFIFKLVSVPESMCSVWGRDFASVLSPLNLVAKYMYRAEKLY